MKIIESQTDINNYKYGRDLCTKILSNVLNLADCLKTLEDSENILVLTRIKEDVKKIRSDLTEPILAELTRNA
jgi:hypothetical protein